MSSRKIAIISDIHGNADALKWTLNRVKLDSVEMTVFLGDLLTYGCQPEEVLNIINNYQSNNKCVFIKGNHDQFYFDINNNINPYNYDVPGFVKESIEWTWKQICEKDFESIFDWEISFELDYIYFAHANPYKYGNWEYVESTDQCLKASNSLQARNKKVGIFGHSHRTKIISISKKRTCTPENEQEIFVRDDSCIILNSGTIGQPRGCGIHYMQICLFDEHISVELRVVGIELNNSVNLIKNSSMSLFTKEKLISYLRS